MHKTHWLWLFDAADKLHPSFLHGVELSVTRSSALLSTPNLFPNSRRVRMSRRHMERIVMLVIVMGPYCQGGIGAAAASFSVVLCLMALGRQKSFELQEKRGS